MKRTWIWFAAATVAFILLLWGWMVLPIDYDLSGAFFAGELESAFFYWLYVIWGYFMNTVKYLLAAGYALALFAVLRPHPKRLMVMLLTGAALMLLGLVGLAGMVLLGWYYTRWTMPFAAALFTSGLLVIVLSFAFRLFKRTLAREEAEENAVAK